MSEDAFDKGDLSSVVDLVDGSGTIEAEKYPVVEADIFWVHVT